MAIYHCSIKIVGRSGKAGTDEGGGEVKTKAAPEGYRPFRCYLFNRDRHHWHPGRPEHRTYPLIINLF